MSRPVLWGKKCAKIEGKFRSRAEHNSESEQNKTRESGKDKRRYRMIAGMTYYQICTYFVIYSFAGWVIEVIFHAVTLGKVVNRGVPERTGLPGLRFRNAGCLCRFVTDSAGAPARKSESFICSSGECCWQQRWSLRQDFFWMFSFMQDGGTTVTSVSTSTAISVWNTASSGGFPSCLR
jgi:hypothetical protein